MAQSQRMQAQSQPTYDLIDHDRLSRLIAAPVSEEPVVSLYVATGTSTQERRLALKNLLRQGEELARGDTEFDDERRKKALAEVAQVGAAADDFLSAHGAPKGTIVAFARDG